MNKTLTLKKNYEFRYVLSKGKYYRGKYIEVFITSNRKNINNIGIAIGTKIGKAVKRNRIKRLIRENYRLLEADIKTGYNIVFLWKKSEDIKNATFANIKIDMISIFKKSGLL